MIVARVLPSSARPPREPPAGSMGSFGRIDVPDSLATSCPTFCVLNVDDQMKLLQQSWSDMLILDHLHQRLHNGLPDDTTLPNGQKFSLVSLAVLGLTSLADQLHHFVQQLQELRFDAIDYFQEGSTTQVLCCMHSSHLAEMGEVRTLGNVRLVHEAQEQTKQVHLEYCLNNYPQMTDKFGQLYQMLPSLKLISTRGEEYLFYKHMSGSAPSQTLLMEMLHAKKK
ncbi:nuclear hormone receptor FTZ-F1, putative [Ixodes scapularis]|uniref:Nuclear hormone receptor FTZ-F1, putative n=1 Tax=Ixodes scapularis TaxID=6945 RepID=B7PST2_IXOSC|nr:nuclear hormone receptor FTZ-F1, putative [Ixodes scapularis]|eukprot:XP_002402946.1 nuclear hormone receptor FTZ-F1, putative [Ixodes scapularis]